LALGGRRRPIVAVITAEVGYSTFARPKKNRLCFISVPARRGMRNDCEIADIHCTLSIADF
jgi:hypothetical protein